MNQKMSSRTASKFKLSQNFGGGQQIQKIHEEDIISSVKFDSTGNYLAIGDNAGRIIIFYQQNQSFSSSNLMSSRRGSVPYDYFTQFQSHSRQFDTLRSTEIGETIIDIKWLRPQGRYQKILSTNSRTIKLWKIYEKQQRRLVKSSGEELAMPRMTTVQNSVASVNQKTFPRLHKKPIHSIDISNNQQYMLSADEGQIMLWNFEKSQKPYLVVDRTNGEISRKQFDSLAASSPNNAERSQHRRSIDIPSTFTSPQYITCCKIHPISDSVFLYGSNKGLVRLSDLRVSANSQNNSVDFMSPPTNQRKNFFSEMLSSVSSLKFLSNSKYLISRDFLTVKVWDICKTDKPVRVISVQDSLKTKLCQIFENECMQDKFMLSASNSSDTILTGNLNNSFHLINMPEAQRRRSFEMPLTESKNEQITATQNSLSSLAEISLKSGDCSSFQSFQMEHNNQNKQNIDAGKVHQNGILNIQYQLNYKKQTVRRPILPGKNEINGKFDCKRKVLAGDFHPSQNIFAVSSLNCFFIYLLP